MARVIHMAHWSDDETVVTDPWWKREPSDTLPDLVVPESHIREVVHRPRVAREEEPTAVMNAVSQNELVQACQRTEQWMVRNGSRQVGPVSTALLVEGILAERVPECCLVRRVGTSAWQPLGGASVFAHALAELKARQ